ncbi:hypothetical protein B0T11DRAFT_279687 [Plectosphaerella cucumerina]|jgi:hypothetical protein|uniref:Infection structure specific protein n=1 Tax=Plectosphaerella cucumerina TaxID=40658 RepID=A0A8K0X3X1_9PEZI|nr:hypothetical protein B0T11DRAFT_279687 [Plectosphaerella cucumerina]
MRSQILFATAATAALIAERQDGACISALGDAQALITGIPPPPTETGFLEFLAGQTGIATQTAECAIPTVTGEPALVSAYNGYVGELTSWLGANGEAVQSVFSVCSSDPQFAQIVSGLNLPVDVATICTEYTFATGGASNGGSTNATATSGANPTSTGDEADASGSGSGAAASSTDAPAAAAHQTGLAVAAVAMAGFAALL